MSRPLKYIEQFGIPTNDIDIYLVANKSDEVFLRKHGKKSKAIGMPYLYADMYDKLEIKRIPNSLLIMPPHGMSYSTHKWA